MDFFEGLLVGAGSKALQTVIPTKAVPVRSGGQVGTPMIAVHALNKGIPGQARNDE